MKIYPAVMIIIDPLLGKVSNVALCEEKWHWTHPWVIELGFFSHHNKLKKLTKSIHWNIWHSQDVITLYQFIPRHLSITTLKKNGLNPIPPSFVLLITSSNCFPTKKTPQSPQSIYSKKNQIIKLPLLKSLFLHNSPRLENS